MFKNIRYKWASIFILGIFLFLSMSCSVKSSIETGKIIYVNDDGNADFKTIQDAINNSLDGDTIFVYNGTYYENVIINKTINLIGENKETTIIDACGKNNAVYISAENVEISGFTIQNSGFYFYSGIYVNSSNNNISDNKIMGNNWGIILAGSSNNTISSNYIRDNLVYGIMLSISHKNIISQNHLENNGYGLYLKYSSNNHIAENTLVKNSIQGIYFELFSNNNTIFHNIFKRSLHSAYFEESFSNIWNQNYWNKPRILPKPIFGKVNTEKRATFKVEFDREPLFKP